MANTLEKSLINAGQYVPPTSRYTNSEVIYYTDLKRITFATYKRKEFVPSDKDRFMTVSKGLEFRPDLVSQRVYGFSDYWWKIMEANGIFDVFDFKAGTNIRIPTATNLML